MFKKISKFNIIKEESIKIRSDINNIKENNIIQKRSKSCFPKKHKRKNNIR